MLTLVSFGDVSQYRAVKAFLKFSRGGLCHTTGLRHRLGGHRTLVGHRTLECIAWWPQNSGMHSLVTTELYSA